MQVRIWVLVGLSVLAIFTRPVLAQCDSGSTGADGAFALTQADNPKVIDLRLANTVPPGDSGYIAGRGYYDPVRWAVIFHYTSISITGNAGNTLSVSFQNHPSGAPVVWLSQGDVTITRANVALSGASGNTSNPLPAVPGPGGFEGNFRGFGVAGSASAGFGPGGGGVSLPPCEAGAGAGYASAALTPCGTVAGGPAYGRAEAVPLIGGSGGSATGGPSCTGGGGAGGGAILIAAGTAVTSATITLDGSSQVIHGIFANGGSGAGSATGGGSGGTIRLVADSVRFLNTLSLSALQGSSFTGCNGASTPTSGRIRIDANTVQIAPTAAIFPAYTTNLVCAQIFPADTPTLRVNQVDGQPVSADPLAGITTTDVSINNTGPATINIQAANVPPGTIVKVRVVPRSGQNPGCPAPTMTCDSTPLSGTMTSSTATATVTFTPGRSEIQLRANW